jgi:two-component system, cell cycle sensor histidine kinase and response regulator CckA
MTGNGPWSDDIEALRVRLGTLIDRRVSDPDGASGQLAAEALEELAVVVEEMQSQYTELLISRDDLEQERERYRNLFEAVPDGYIVTDSDGIMREVNATAAQLFGRAVKQLNGKPLGSLVEPSDRRAFYGQLARIRHDRPGSHFSINLTVHDHTTVPANLRATIGPQRTGGRPDIRWLIHDRRPDIAERDVRLSEERLRSLVDTAGVGFVLTDTHGTLIFSNQTADRLIRRGHDAVTAAEWLSTTHDADRAAVVQALRDACLDGASTLLRHRIATPGGEITWVEHGITPFRTPTGTLIGSVSTFTDVTAEHNALLALGDSRDFTDAVLDTVGALVVVLSPDGEITRFNKTCESTTGFAASAMIGRRMVDALVPPDQRGEIWSLFAERGSDARPTPFESDWYTSAGGRRTISWTTTALTGADGSVRAIIGTGIDVTETRVLKARLEQASRLESVGRLAAGIAHDFNNTLSTLQLRIDRLARRNSDSESERDNAAAAATIRHTQHIIADLLSFGGQQQLHPQIIDLNVETRRIISLLTELLGDGIALSLDLIADTTTVTIDPGRFEQALTNLLLNARDALPNGGKVALTSSVVDTESVPAPPGVPPDLAPGTYVRLSVADTGVGIRPDDMSRIFDPYFTTKHSTRGTGLGLATTYGTITQSGGAITVDSARGVGSVFTLWLPRSEVGTASPARTAGQADPGPMLIVEPEVR